MLSTNLAQDQSLKNTKDMQHTQEIQEIKSHSFFKFLRKQKKCRKLILNFLQENDLTQLKMTNKKIKKMVLISKREKKLNPFMNHLKDIINKSKNKPKGKIFKTSIFKLDAEVVDQYEWILLNQTEAETNELYDTLSDLIPSKFTKTFSHSVFYNRKMRKYLVFNRSLTDPRTEMFYKFNIRTKEIDEESDSKRIQQIMDRPEFHISNFENLPNGYLLRHKLVLDELKKEKEEFKMESELNTNQIIKKALNAERISLVMCKGGYFSVGVFDKEKRVTHGSDHKYVIRKKQGNRQSLKDKSGGKFHSMGAQMRRANEVLHQENIEAILKQNLDLIRDSDFILVHSPGENEGILFENGKSLFELKTETKLRNICLSAKRANYTEVRRLYDELSKVYVISENLIYDEI